MVLFTGKTVDEAIEKGLSELGLTRLSSHIKVVSREKKGFLGFGKQPAQVEISEIDKSPRPIKSTAQTLVSSEEIDKANAPQSSRVTAPSLLPTSETEVAESSESTERLDDEPAVADINQAQADVVAYLEKIIYEMDVEATLHVSHTKGQIHIQIETPEAGRVIGYHGKVLKALQLLAQNFLHDKHSRYFSISLNVHDYNEHRRETLIDHSQKMAKRVLDTGQPVTMDPMSNQERKIVHKTISRISGVISLSQGKDPNRYVVISKQ